MSEANEKSDRVMRGVATWCSFYRANPHRFAKDYLNISLKWFQKILLVMMNLSTNFCYIASRGQGKTFLVALFCVIRCILYPGTTVCVASKTRRQANEVVIKIKDIFMPNSSNLRMEISDIKINQYDTTVEFQNGSVIRIVTASDNSRGNRCQILICDEYRMLDQAVVNSVLRKFLTAYRHPGFMDKPEYADYKPEENKEIYMSSAWFENSWSYDLFKSYAANMVTGRTYFTCDLPYQLAIKEKLLSRERVENEMSESTFSDISWLMEMEGLFFSGADGALYSYDEISPSRRIKYAFYPPQLASILSDKRIKIPPKLHNEVRILSADIALMASGGKNNNDATSILINQMQLTDSGRGLKNIVYAENNEGLRTEEQALIIRRLFHFYDCDHLVIDARGVGLPVVDELMDDMYDAELGITYGALSCCNNSDIAARCKVKGAPKKIWAITATQEFNSQCALGLREEFRDGNIRLLISEEEFDEVFSQLSGYSKLSVEERARLKATYINTYLLINELINLEYETKNGVVRVKEKSGMRKDRYSSLSYNIYVAKQIEREYASEKAKKDFQQMIFQFRQPKTGRR